MVMYQRAEERHAVYIVNYRPQRRSPRHIEILDAPIPLRDVEIKLRRPEPTTRVFLALSGEDLPFTSEEEVVLVSVPRVGAFYAVIFE